MADGKITIQTKIDQKGAKKGLSNLQKSVGASAKKMKKIGGQMSKYLTAPLLALGGAGFVAADQLDKAYRDIQVGTGATGDALEDLKKSFKEVFENVPDSADQVSNALANLNTFTGASGEALEDLTKGVLDASRTLKEDGVANAEAFGKAMKQWKVPAKEGTEVLDGLYKLTQDYGVGLGEISGQLTTYGSVLNNAGFSMQESAQFMASLESEGIAVSRVMPGLNASFRKWADEGKNSRKEFDKVIKTIAETEDKQEALSIATETFGAEGAQRLMTGIRNGAIPALDELGKSMEGTKGLVEDTTNETKTVGEQFQELKNQTVTALEPLGKIMIELAQNYIPPLIQAIKGVAEWFANLSPVAQQAIFIIGAIIAILPPLIMLAGSLALAIMGISWPVLAVVAGIALLIAIGIALWANWDTIKAKAIEIWEAIKEFFVQTWESITKNFEKAKETMELAMKMAWEFIKRTTESVWNSIKDFFVGIWEGIAGVFDSAVEKTKKTIKASWDWIKGVTKSVWNEIKDFFGGIWDSITSGVEGFKNAFLGVWRGIKNGIRAIINPIIGFINKLIGGIESMVNAVAGGINELPSFDIPDWVPKYGGGTFGLPEIPNVSLPRIPSLDVGTNLVKRDGLAMIHKGEQIVPAEHTGPYKEGEAKQINVKPSNIYMSGRKVGEVTWEVVEELMNLNKEETDDFAF